MERCRWNQAKGPQLLATRSSGGAGRPSRDCRAGIQEKKMSLSGSKTHTLWYADGGREAKKEIVDQYSP